MDLGVQEILQAGRELIAPTNPYMRRESEKMVRGRKYVVPYAVSKMMTPVAGLVPGITIKGLNEKIDRGFEDRVGGFGAPAVDVASKAGKAAVSAKMIQAAIKGAGAAKKAIPKTRAAALREAKKTRNLKAIERSINDSLKKNPELFDKTEFPTEGHKADAIIDKMFSEMRAAKMTSIKGHGGMKFKKLPKEVGEAVKKAWIKNIQDSMGVDEGTAKVIGEMANDKGISYGPAAMEKVGKDVVKNNLTNYLRQIQERWLEGGIQN